LKKEGMEAPTQQTKPEKIHRICDLRPSQKHVNLIYIVLEKGIKRNIKNLTK
jgi:hypothetical protein